MVLRRNMAWQALRLIRGPRWHMATQACHEWTSEINVSKPQSEWSLMCSCGLLNTMELSDGRFGTTFQKWSSRTACSRRWTICAMQCYCMQYNLHGQDVQRSSAGQHMQNTSVACANASLCKVTPHYKASLVRALY